MSIIYKERNLVKNFFKKIKIFMSLTINDLCVLTNPLTKKMLFALTKMTQAGFFLDF
jgi:hypothetical protein